MILTLAWATCCLPIIPLPGKTPTKDSFSQRRKGRKESLAPFAPLREILRRTMSAARIVVVEDEPAIRRGVVDVLRVNGYEVAEAADGDRGLTEAVRLGVDLVLLDLLLPRRDGLDVLVELRKVRP